MVWACGGGRGNMVTRSSSDDELLHPTTPSVDEPHSSLARGYALVPSDTLVAYSSPTPASVVGLGGLLVAGGLGLGFKCACYRK